MEDSSKYYNNALPEDYMLDDFKIIKVLGAGGFGIAYLAKDTYLNQQCVIKEYMPKEFAYRDSYSGAIHSTSSSSAENYEWGLKEFLNEARTIAKFNHPNIVQVSRFFRENNTAYIVMPYFEGDSLDELLKLAPNERATEEELRNIVIPLLEGLQIVHAQHIFHRDIKPSNIYICDNGNTPILIDFGAARFSLGSHSRSITTIVTPGYSPHEQYHQHGKQGAWTDIYSMAAVMYHLIDGKMPIESPARVGDDDPLIPASTIGKGKYSSHLLKAIDHALEFNVNDRPQSVEEWLLEINGITLPPQKPPRKPVPNPEPAPISEPIKSPEPTPTPTIPTIAWIVIAALVIGVAVLGVTVFQKTPPVAVQIERVNPITPAVVTPIEPENPIIPATPSIPPPAVIPSLPVATECNGQLNSAQIQYLVTNKIALGTRLDVPTPYKWLELQKSNGEAAFRKEGGNASVGKWRLGNDQLCWCYGGCTEYKCKYVEAANNCTVWYYIDSETGKKTGKVHEWKDIE